jgi:hypothetical protein
VKIPVPDLIETPWFGLGIKHRAKHHLPIVVRFVERFKMRHGRDQLFANASSEAFRSEAMVLRYASSAVTLCLYLYYSCRSSHYVFWEKPNEEVTSRIRGGTCEATTARYKTGFLFATSPELLSWAYSTVRNTQAHYVHLGVVIKFRYCVLSSLCYAPENNGLLSTVLS